MSLGNWNKNVNLGKVVKQQLPALPAEPFVFHQAPSPDAHLAMPMLEWPQSSFGPTLQPG